MSMNKSVKLSCGSLNFEFVGYIILGIVRIFYHMTFIGLCFFSLILNERLKIKITFQTFDTY